MLVFDAAGLALFAVVGTQKALSYRLNPLTAALLGVLTGIGGGMLRIAGAALCFGIRYVAIRRGWHLPVAALPQRSK